MAGSSRAESKGARRRAGLGFTVVEIGVVAGVLGVIATVAVPNVLEAVDNKRKTSCYSSLRQLDVAIHLYGSDHRGPPAALDTRTLEPLVSAKCLTPRERDALLAQLEGERISFYLGGTDWWTGEQDYILAFRPKAERDPSALCYMWPEATWAWSADGGWREVVR